MSLETKMKLQTLFYQGRCEDVLAQTVDEPGVEWQFESAAVVIGALCFLGRVEEADFRCSRLLPHLNADDQAACLFFLAVGWVRCSAYDKARNFIIQNLRLARANPKRPVIAAFARQSQAFYRHFCGRYHLAFRAAERALEASIEANHFFLRMFATDLLGHTHVERGEIAIGLQELELAHKLALKLGHGSFAKAISKALTSYRVQYGLINEDNLSILQELIQESKVQDTFTDSYMILELIRQLTVRGRVSEAETWLQTVSRAIYASRHRRQRVLMNLRWAEIYFIRRNESALREKLDLARLDIDPAVDLALLVSWQGLIIKAEINVSAEFLAEHKRATSRLGSGIALRIASRTLGLKHQPAIGDDPLGDLIDTQKKFSETELFQTIVKSGYLNLLRGTLRLPQSRNFLYFHQPSQTLILGRNGDTFAAETGSSAKLFELLKSFYKGCRSKEELVTDIWAYDYNPLRHDSLLYTLISRLRALLGPCASWLENHENGYSLAQDVDIILGETKAREREPEANKSIFVESSLNSRQWSILEYLKKNKKDLGPDECSELFKISKVTATRDLSGLFKAGYIIRHGKGRATRYGHAEAQT